MKEVEDTLLSLCEKSTTGRTRRIERDEQLSDYAATGKPRKVAKSVEMPNKRI
jgi:hypothetical protein